LVLSSCQLSVLHDGGVFSAYFHYSSEIKGRA
jgi:hypothetical protein